MTALATGCVARPPEPPPLVPLESAAVGAVEVYGPGLLTTDSSGETLTFALTASASVVIVRVWPGWRLEQLYPFGSKDSTRFHTGMHTVRVRAPVPWSPAGSPGQSVARAPASADLQVEDCVWQEVRRRQTPPPPTPQPGDTSRRAQAPQRRPAQPVNYGEIEDQCRRAVAQRAALAPATRPLVAAPEHYLVLVASDLTQDARHLRIRLGGVDITKSSLTSVLQVLPQFLAGADAKTWAGYVARVGGR